MNTKLNPGIIDEAPVAESIVFNEKVRDSSIWKFLRNVIIPTLSFADVIYIKSRLDDGEFCQDDIFDNSSSVVNSSSSNPLIRVINMLDSKFGHNSFDSYNYEVIYEAFLHIIETVKTFKDFQPGSKFLLMEDLYYRESGLRTFSKEFEDWGKKPIYKAGKFAIWDGERLKIENCILNIPSDTVVTGKTTWIPFFEEMDEKYTPPIYFSRSEIIVNVFRFVYDEDYYYDTSKLIRDYRNKKGK
jgi:hypothetical protein